MQKRVLNKPPDVYAPNPQICGTY